MNKRTGWSAVLVGLVFIGVGVKLMLEGSDLAVWPFILGCMSFGLGWVLSADGTDS